MPELLVILAVALIVVGPRRLPEMARAIGRMVGQVRAATSQIQRQVEREMSAIHPEDDRSDSTRPPSPPAPDTPAPPSDSERPRDH